MSGKSLKYKPMLTNFKNIKVIIWDFDKTLYPPNSELEQAIRDAEFTAICKHTGWTYDQAAEEFYKLYKIKYVSATKTVSEITGMSIIKVNEIVENLYDRRKYLKKDPQLIKLFRNLSGFRHLMLVNGVKNRVKQGLKRLGLNFSLFEDIVTPENTGVTKPDPKAFKYILNLTKLPAGNHLMVGDRELVDLVPAKNLGMKTCLVWSKKKSKITDVTLPTIYEINNILEI